MGDMGTTYGGLTGKSKDDFGHGAAWFVPYTNVFDNPVGDSTRLERVEIDPSQNVVRRGDALFTVSSETPEEVGMSSVWPSDLDDLYLNSFCFGYRQDGSFDPSYLAYMLRADSFRNQIEMLAQGISRFNISKGKVMEIEVPVPNKREQARIGRLFVDLDSLITLHQRKRKYRGLYGYLSWEQRKLGELFVESDERSSTEEILSVSVANGIYPASESERDTNPGASIANYKIVRVGDIVYNSMRMWQGAVGSSRYNGIVSPAYVVAKPVVELDSTCFGYLLKRPELLYKYLCNSQGNSKDTQTLRYERFAKITAEVPSTIEEQRAISDCLEGLDNLITLHQREPRFADTG